jgi:hypothetical protein
MKNRMLTGCGGIILSLLIHVPALAQQPPEGPDATTLSPEIQSQAHQAVDQAAADAGLSAGAIEKLEPELVYDLVRYKIEQDSHARKMENIDVVGVVVPISFFLFTFLVFGGVLLHRSRRDRQKHETLRIMVEKGADIPPAFLDPPASRITDLRKGILLLASGLGLGLFLLVLSAWEPEAIRGAPVGLFPALLGLGYLLVWKLEKKSAD